MGVLPAASIATTSAPTRCPRSTGAARPHRVARPLTNWRSLGGVSDITRISCNAAGELGGRLIAALAPVRQHRQRPYSSRRRRAAARPGARLRYHCSSTAATRWTSACASACGVRPSPAVPARRQAVGSARTRRSSGKTWSTAGVKSQPTTRAACSSCSVAAAWCSQFRMRASVHGGSPAPTLSGAPPTSSSTR